MRNTASPPLAHTCSATELGGPRRRSRWTLPSLGRNGEILSRDGRLPTAEQGCSRGTWHLRDFAEGGKKRTREMELGGMEQREKIEKNQGFAFLGSSRFGVTNLPLCGRVWRRFEPRFRRVAKRPGSGEVL